MARKIDRDGAVPVGQMRDLLVPAMAVAARAMNHDDGAAAGKIGDDLGQRGLARIMHIDRVSVDMDVLGRHRRTASRLMLWKGLLLGSGSKCQTRNAASMRGDRS